MNINLSEKTIKTVLSALYSSRYDLKRQCVKHNNDKRKFKIIQSQLKDVNDAISTFEEFFY